MADPAEHDNDTTAAATVAARRVAVITGASSGIGRAVAVEFARQGYDLVLTARRKAELQKTAEACETAGARAIGVMADVTDQAALEKVAEAAERGFGGFDIWVNNAAVSVYGKFLDVPDEDFRRLLDTNIMGYVNGARIALRQFRRKGSGTLINISSINAVAPVPFSAAYVASKFAIRGLSESLRLELAVEGLADRIQVCNVMPASIDTNFFQNAANYMQREVQAVEPVYDPTYVARHIVKLAAKPRREVIIGPAAKVLALEHALMPDFYERTVGRYINFNNFSTKPAADSHGSLYQPVAANTGTRGGWRRKRLGAGTLNLALGVAGAALLGLVAAGMVAAHRHKGTSNRHA